MAGIYLALGSNLGDRLANLRRALELLGPAATVEAVSPVYVTTPQPPAAPPAYYNAACRIRTSLPPRQLLQHLKKVEQQLGRRPAERWAPRTLDLDIVLYDEVLVDEPDLVVPHARLAERSFVLQPLLDLNADLTHPRTGERLDALLRALGEEPLLPVGILSGQS